MEYEVCSPWTAQEICICRYGQSLTRLLFNNSFEASRRQVLVPMKFDMKHGHKPECTTGILDTRKLTPATACCLRFEFSASG